MANKGHELDVTDDDVIEAAQFWNDWIIETRIRRGRAYHTNASPYAEFEAIQDDFARLIRCVPILEAYFQRKLNDHLHKVFTDNARVWFRPRTTKKAPRPILADLETCRKDLSEDDCPF
jgi:hypothetical protein